MTNSVQHTSSAQASVELDRIRKTFGKVVAVDSVSLVLEAGRLLSLLGPSGCGKTSVLRMIAGLEQPDSGVLRVAGRDLTRVPPHKRGLGMVFQNYSLFPHMTVGENVAFGLKMARVPSSEVAPRVARALDMVRLSGFSERYIQQMSGGQQQRVALARSIVTHPSVLLLDEPLGALDKNLRENMQFELRQLQQRLGITAILVTHDQEEALTMSDVVAVMNRGKILQTGAPSEIYDRPRSRFVSEFLGASNTLSGVVSQAGADGMVSIDLEGPAGAKAVVTGAAPKGSKAIVAIRPEKVHLKKGWDMRSPSPVNSLRARLSDRIFRGSQYVFQLRLEGRSETFTAYRSPISGDPLANAPPNTEITASWDAGDAVVLENE